MKFIKKTSSYYLWLDTFRCFLLTLAISLFLYLTAINIPFLDPFQKAFEELDFTDIYYSRNMFSDKHTDDIILVNIATADRCQIAGLISKIANQNPKTIGIDVLFKDTKEPYCDSILSNTINITSNLITSYSYQNPENSNFFEKSNLKQGYVTSDIYNDNEIVRDFVGVKKNESEGYKFSFPVLVSIESNNIDKTTAISKLSDKTRINYFGRKENFMTFNIEDFANDRTIQAMENSIVLIGYLGETKKNINNIEDKHYTPLNTKFVGRSRPDMYGLTIHANIIKMLESREYLFKAPKFIVYLLAFLSAIFWIRLGIKLSKTKPIIYDLALKPIILVFSIIILFLTLCLVKLGFQLNITLILFFTIFGVETIGLYKYVIDYAKRRFKWKSYLD